jgi:2-polyprenyl-3-methyl-5-hydroxy-6-metoxy-1,4-benzoquinol methylase
MADIADLTARPATFIAEQADVNTYHSNGEIEVEDEDALRYLQRFAWFDKELELSSLLDIGCRSGYVMRKAAKIWPDACVLGLDINELTLRHAPTRASSRFVTTRSRTSSPSRPSSTAGTLRVPPRSGCVSRHVACTSSRI